MARKINLKGLFNGGDLTHILNGSQDSSSDGVASMFDGLTTTKLVINQTIGNPTQTFNFASPILCNKLFIKIRTRETDINSISLNGQTASAQSALSISSDSSVISTFTFNTNILNSLFIEHTDAFSNDHLMFEIEIFILEESNTGVRIDRADGDIIEDTENPIEDDSLQYIPDFSYVIINKSVTINKDNSIKVTDLSTFNTSPGGINRRTGFDREFQTNIPDGSFIGLKNLDADIKDRSNTSYKVYFNAGRLQPMFIGINNRTAVTAVSASKNSFHCTNNALINDGSTIFVPNMAKLKSFLPPTVPVTNTDLTPFIRVGGSIINSILGNLDSNERFFVTLLKTEGEAAPSPDAKDITPIRTTIVRSISGSDVILPTQNLAELSTAEIASHDLGSANSTLSKRFSFNQNYGLLDDVSDNPDPANFSGSFAISHLNEEKPALLLNLTKEVEFPEGIGRTPLVIIPETLHPYIKDNIPQFMARAGFDIGNITQVNTLDETNRNLS